MKKIGVARINKAETILNEILRNSQLTVVCFYGPNLEIKFESHVESKGPNEFVLLSAENIFVLPKNNNEIPKVPQDNEAFHELRGETFKELHSLFANEVKSIKISREGVLEICFSDKHLYLVPEEDEYAEEYWSFSEKSHDPFFQSDWYIGFDGHELIIRTPNHNF